MRAAGKPAGMGLELIDIADKDRPVLERVLAEKAARVGDLSGGGPG